MTSTARNAMSQQIEATGTPGWYRTDGIVDLADHLSKLAVAAVGTRKVSVVVVDALDQADGMTGRVDEDWVITVSAAQTLAGAEETTLHETGHVLGGHVGDPACEAAVRAGGTALRRFEEEAIAIGAAMMDEVSGELRSNPDELREEFAEDLGRYDF